MRADQPQARCTASRAKPFIARDGSITRARYQAGIELRHAFLRELIGSAGVSYGVQDYAGVLLEEEELKAALGLEYHLSREAMLFGHYQHTAFRSTDTSRNCDADEVRVGVRLRR